VDIHGDAVLVRLPEDIDYAGITQIRAILLERQTEYQHPTALRYQVAPGHELDDPTGDEGAHAVVEAAAGEDDLRAVTDGLRLVSEIVGIDANTVSAY